MYRKYGKVVKFKNKLLNYFCELNVYEWNANGYFWVNAGGIIMKRANFVWLWYNDLPIRKNGIPQGCLIHHKDRNKSNDKIENLMLLPKDIHMSLHAKFNNKWGSNPK